MSTVEDIERAVSRLTPDELARFRAWFETCEAYRFDKKIESDARAGKLDQLAEEALATSVKNGCAGPVEQHPPDDGEARGTTAGNLVHGHGGLRT